jgi:hypothetical protein
MPMLAIAAATASATQTADPRYRNELIRWTNRPEWSEDGVPVATAVRRVPRRVPVRDFALAVLDALPINPGGDQGAAYLVLYHRRDEPPDWLRAGEALSALLLTATAQGLATEPMSDVVEVPHSRSLVGRILGEPGCPYLVVRCGVAVEPLAVGRAPRRAPVEVIDHLPLAWATPAYQRTTPA